MNSYSLIYWLTRLDSLQVLGGIMTIGSLAAFFIYTIHAYTEVYDDEDRAAYFKKNGWIKRTSIFFLVLGTLIMTFVPDRNEAIMIIAGGKAIDYAKKDTSLSKLPYQTTAFISDYLDKAIKDLKKDEKE